VLRPWLWILVGLCSLIIYPQLSDIQKAFPHLDPSLIGHDIAYPAMLKFLPVGFIGLMVGGLIAANSSTILTHLNWGASYLVHDFYQRFVHQGASEKHYVLVGRLTTIGLFACAAATVYLLDTAKDAFDIILQVGAGTGLLYLMRWFWWRINAWSEISAMSAALLISISIKILQSLHILVFPKGLGFAYELIIIDNKSTDATCAIIKNQFSQAILLAYWRSKMRLYFGKLAIFNFDD
jgi:Na+/proline symporter